MLTLAITYRRRAASVRDQRYYRDADHSAWAALRAAGVLRTLHRRIDGRGVVAMIETSDAAAVRIILDALPTVEMGACSYTTLGVETGVFDAPAPGQPSTNGAGGPR